MPTVDDLDPAQRAAVADHGARMKHDLGKYVAMQTRWTAPDAPIAERRAALTADLLQTRRGPDGESDACAVWEGFRPGWFGEAPLIDGSTIDLRADPDVAEIVLAMALVKAAIDALRAGPDADPTEGASAAIRVADACQRLHRRARGA